MQAQKDYRIGILFVTLSAIAWSLAGYFTRLIPLDSFTLLAWRGLFGALGLFVVIVAFRGRAWSQDFARMGRAEYAYVAITVCGMILFITSLGHTSVAHGAVIYATIPFLAALLGWIFLREIPGPVAIRASLAALAGVVLMVGFGSDGGLFGDLLAFGMTTCMAFSIILMRRNPGMSAMSSACLGGVISGLICWPFGSPLDVTDVQLAQMALFGVINSSMGLACFAIGSKRLPAIETALIGSLDAPLAPLWVWLAFDERPGINTLVGGGIVFAAVILHIVLSQRRAVPAPA
jgi:drug/metabolite transporter (DMT)-like permease